MQIREHIIHTNDNNNNDTHLNSQLQDNYGMLEQLTEC